MRLSGYYKIDSIRNGIRSIKSPLTRNLITQSGLNRLSVGAAATYCFLGDGTSEPNYLDTSLENKIAQANLVKVNEFSRNNDPYGSYTIYEAEFSPPPTEIMLAELGIGWQDGIFTRARIVNLLGIESVLPWLSDETLIVTYVIGISPPHTDSEYTLTINGENYDVTCRPAKADDKDYWSFNGSSAQDFIEVTCYTGGSISDKFGLPSGTSITIEYSRLPDPSELSHFILGNLFIDANNGNEEDGISTLLVRSTMGAMQYQFDPPITKTNLDVISINFSTPIWGANDS